MRLSLRVIVVGALLVATAGVTAVATPAPAVTGVHFTYSPTSGPVNTVIHFTATGCGAQSGGLFTLEINPANPSGEQSSATFDAGGVGQLTVFSSLAAGHYQVQSQCFANSFDPTYAPCGFTVTTTPGTAGACDSTTGSIVTNPNVAIGDASVVEGNAGQRSLRFAVSLSKPATSAATVTYASHSGTATSGSDFVAKSGTVSIPKGSTSAAIVVSVKGDTTREADETLTVKLAAATEAVITKATGKATILNDDPSSGVRVSIGNGSVMEGGSGARTLLLTASLSKATSKAVTVHYATHAGTAAAGTDFTAKSGTATMPKGATSVAVKVAVKGDTKVESNETFTVKLTSPSGAVLGRATGTATILKDD